MKRKQSFILNSEEVFGPSKPLTFETLPDFFWIMSINRYFHKYTGDLYTEDELQEIDKLSNEHKQSLPYYNFYDYITMFPEAKVIAKKYIKTEIKVIKQKIVEVDEWRNGPAQNIINNLPFQDQTFYKKWFDEKHEEERSKLERRAKKLIFKLSLTEAKVEKREGKINEQDIENAKQIQILDIFPNQITRSSRVTAVKCPFHVDKTPSFTIYPRQNTFYCYSCHVGGTVIDFVMNWKKIEFLEAVKFLLNK
jgi:hypothetical protein